MRSMRAEAGLRHAGFTLLEVLVAVAIFAVAAQLTFGGLRNILHGREQLLPRHEEAANLRYAVSLMSQDLVAAAPRAIRDALGDTAPALRAGEGTLIELSRLDAARPTLLDAVGVYRVSYRLDEGVLTRETWPVLDPVQGTEPVRQALIDGILEVRFRFLDRAIDSPWSELWPPAEVEAARIPRAIEFELRFEDGRSLRRLLLPASGS